MAFEADNDPSNGSGRVECKHCHRTGRVGSYGILGTRKVTWEVDWAGGDECPSDPGKVHSPVPIPNR